MHLDVSWLGLFTFKDYSKDFISIRRAHTREQILDIRSRAFFLERNLMRSATFELRIHIHSIQAMMNTIQAILSYV